jgi:CubicO group peptidase (beta-lactamase class C family)
MQSPWPGRGWPLDLRLQSGTVIALPQHQPAAERLRQLVRNSQAQPRADGASVARILRPHIGPQHGQHIHINPAAELVVVKLSTHPVPNTAFTHVADPQANAALAAAVRSR